MKNPLRNLPKEKIQHLLLVGILSLIAVCAIFMFWISDRYGIWKSSREKVNQLIPQIEAAERAGQAETQNEALRRQLISLVEIQKTKMVTGDLFSWGLREMTLFAEKYPVQMTSLRPGQRTPHPRESGYETYGISVDLKGGYDEIGQFIAAFENRFPTAQIRSMSFLAGDSAAAERMATLEIGFLIWPESGNVWITPKSKQEPKKTP